MGKSGKVQKRRFELYRRMLGTETLREIAEDQAEEYDMKAKSILNDWYNREEWVDDIFLGTDTPDFEDLVAEKKMTMKEAWDVIEEVKNSDEKPDYGHLVRALKQIDKSAEDIIKLLQSHGDIEKEPEKHEVRQRIEKVNISVDTLDVDEIDEDEIELEASE